MLPYVRVVSATPSTTAKVLTVFIKGGPLYKFRKSGKLRSQYFQGHPYILLVSRFMSPSFLHQGLTLSKLALTEHSNVSKTL